MVTKFRSYEEAEEYFDGIEDKAKILNVEFPKNSGEFKQLVFYKPEITLKEKKEFDEKNQEASQNSSFMEGTKSQGIVVKNISEYKENVKRWLYFEDDDVLDIVLAGMVAEKVGGDPIWLLLIAPPGGSKTELLRSFTGEFVYPLSDMTSKTLISGLMVGEGDKRRKIEDLLPQLNGKTLVFKDFTTILEKGGDERREIIAQFREAYDGTFSKKVGTVDKPIRYESRFGFVAGVTPIIDKHWKVMQQLGERFLKVRWNEKADKTTEKSMQNEGKEIEMRKDLMANSNAFIEALDFTKIPTFDEEKYGKDIMNLAKFVAKARTPLSIRANKDDFYHDYIPMSEVPTRLVKQLKKMAKCLAFVRNKEQVTDEEMNIMIRIAKDTTPPDRMAILEVIREFEALTIQGCPRNKIFTCIKMPESSIRLVLEQLKLLDLITISNNPPTYETLYRTTAIYPHISCTLQEKSGGINFDNMDAYEKAGLGEEAKKILNKQEGKK